MKIEKNKIVFASLLLTILLFLIGYSMMVMEKEGANNEELKQLPVPELGKESKQYKSKLDAVNDLKEERERTAPSLYDEKLIDSLGYYDIHYHEREKEQLIQELLATDGQGHFDNSNQSRADTINSISLGTQSYHREDRTTLIRERAVEHNLFFASIPGPEVNPLQGDINSVIYAVVDGDQIVRADYRLRMRILDSITLNEIYIPKNTPLFGFVRFKENRTLIEIENIAHHPVSLKVFDMEDGSEGIYTPNHFRAEASREVLNDIIPDLSIPGVPQVKGITKVLRRDNRNIKATILNNYKLILKPKK